MIGWRVAKFEMLRAARESSLPSRGAALVLVTLAVLAVTAPLSGYTPGTDVDPDLASMGPSTAHLLGTDHLGRDLAFRMWFATRAFVFPGALAALVTCLVGTGLGATSGWVGGWTTLAIRWITGSIAAIPRFVWVLLVCASWGDRPAQLGVAVGLAYSPALAEAVHGRLETLRSTDYLLAARAHGVSGWRRLWLHGLVAGCGRLIARHGVLCFGYFLVVETTLAYIGGFGVQEPAPSLGNMIAFEWGWSQGALAPAAAVWIAVAAVVFLADGLREARHG